MFKKILTITIIAMLFCSVSTAKMRGIIGDNENTDKRAVRLDPSTHSLITTDCAHTAIHEGESFFSEAVEFGIASGGTLVLAFKTPTNTRKAHLLVDFMTLLGSHCEILEGPTWDNQSGSLSPIFNRNRESSNSSTLLEDQGQASFIASDNLILNPTGLSGGTALPNGYAFGAKNKIGAGASRSAREIVLKPDTQYAVVLTSDASSNDGFLSLNWHEQQDRT